MDFQRNQPPETDAQVQIQKCIQVSVMRTPRPHNKKVKEKVTEAAAAALQVTLLRLKSDR